MFFLQVYSATKPELPQPHTRSLDLPHMSYNTHVDSMSAVDGTTVIGGPLSNIGDASYMGDSFPKKPSTHGKDNSPARHGSPPQNLFETAEYIDTERAFFIPIAKDGLIVALQKLDTQLKNVSLPPDSREFELTNISCSRDELTFSRGR